MEFFKKGGVVAVDCGDGKAGGAREWIGEIWDGEKVGIEYGEEKGKEESKAAKKEEIESPEQSEPEWKGEKGEANSDEEGEAEEESWVFTPK